MSDMETGNIVKQHFPENFVRIHNSIARNPHLTLKAKGLLLVIMSLPDNWTIHISQLPDFCEESKTAVRTAFKELEKKGFILSVDMRDASTGRFKGKNYMAYYESQTLEELMVNSPKNPVNKASHPHAGNRDAVKPDADSKTLQRNSEERNMSNKEKGKKEILDADKNFSSIDYCIEYIKQHKTLPTQKVPKHLHSELNKYYAIIQDNFKFF